MRISWSVKPRTERERFPSLLARYEIRFTRYEQRVGHVSTCTTGQVQEKPS
jgi:hypothetical protein